MFNDSKSSKVFMSGNNTQYTEDNIKTLEPREHVRLRPGMYIGKLGDGSSVDDGIYILLKEVVDNSIDEFRMKFGKRIDVKISDGKVIIRDYGRGIPLGKIVDVVSIMNTGGKYDDGAFKKSIGLNGVGTKAVNFLSSYFQVKSIRNGKTRTAEFREGILSNILEESDTSEKNGTEITFIPDNTIFVNYKFRHEYVEKMLRNYTYLNLGLKIYYNGEIFESQNGLKDLLENEMSGHQIVYPIIHIKDEDMEIAITHSDKSQSETYFSFVNGQYTSQGGTHLNAFKEAFVKTIKEFYSKNFEATDIRKAIIGAIYINVGNPVFESQTKTKLGSTTMGQDKDGNELETIRTFVNNYLKNKLDNFLHKNPEITEALQKKILISERERKELSGIQKLARERAKKVSLHNKKLRDCRQHYNDQKAPRKSETQIFITEGDSASGSITKIRDVETQAVFSLKGKPLNCYGLTKKIVYENEEFNLLQAALNIEESMEDLRYNQVIIATDADVDGMHIRLLMITFFLQFFPDVIKNGHLYILQTPLFRIRNKKEIR